MSDQDRPAGREPSAFELAALIVEECAEAKGQDISVMDVSTVFDLAQYFIIISGRSDRQVQGICSRIENELTKHHIKPSGVEGFERAHWVLMDYADVVVHIFYEPIRELYRLDALWRSAPRLKVSDERGKTSLQAA